jgi:plasmid stabilization system protein ParE
VTPVHLRRIAQRDLHDAVAWYRDRDVDLANRFLNEVYKALGMIERFPNTGGPVYGVSDRDTRQLPVDTFPYQIIFKRLKYRIVVLAIAHERKRPGYWNT